MLIPNKNNSAIYNFATKWLFSTNHKDIGTLLLITDYMHTFNNAVQELGIEVFGLTFVPVVFTCFSCLYYHYLMRIISYVLSHIKTIKFWHLCSSCYIIGFTTYFILAGFAMFLGDYWWYLPNIESSDDILKNLENFSLPDNELENSETEKPLAKNKESKKPFIQIFILGCLIMYAFVNMKY